MNATHQKYFKYIQILKNIPDYVWRQLMSQKYLSPLSFNYFEFVHFFFTKLKPTDFLLIESFKVDESLNYKLLDYYRTFLKNKLSYDFGNDMFTLIPKKAIFETDIVFKTKYDKYQWQREAWLRIIAFELCYGKFKEYFCIDILDQIDLNYHTDAILQMIIERRYLNFLNKINRKNFDLSEYECKNLYPQLEKIIADNDFEFLKSLSLVFKDKKYPIYRSDEIKCEEYQRDSYDSDMDDYYPPKCAGCEHCTSKRVVNRMEFEAWEALNLYICRYAARYHKKKIILWSLENIKSSTNRILYVLAYILLEWPQFPKKLIHKYLFLSKDYNYPNKRDWVIADFDLYRIIIKLYNKLRFSVKKYPRRKKRAINRR